jgi:hypothetical protein
MALLLDYSSPTANAPSNVFVPESFENFIPKKIPKK